MFWTSFTAVAIAFICLSIAQTLKLLEKLDSGVSLKSLTEDCGVEWLPYMT